MRKIISLICLILPIAAQAEELQIRENAPDRYQVVKGDTLWDISSKFFKNPWKWPEIWGYNKDTIKDPHWIYPGNIVYLDKVSHTLKIEGQESGEPAGAMTPAHQEQANQPVAEGSSQPDLYEKESISTAGVTKLSPHVRFSKGRSDALPVISLKDIGPFLSRPLVIDEDELDNSPVLVGTYEQRQLVGANDVAYAKNMPGDKGYRWQIYRDEKTFKDPDTNENLGHEVSYLGDANVEKFGDITSLRITKSVHEIGIGDHFAQSVSGFSSNYLPHAPEKEISAKVISIYGGVLQAGQNAIITLNKGKRDGVEVGHVLALYQKGEELSSRNIFKPNVILPDVRYGLVFVFRVFDKVSYALVMETRLPVELLDLVSSPD